MIDTRRWQKCTISYCNAMCRSAPRHHLFPKHYCCFLLEVFVCGEAQTMELYVFLLLLLLLGKLLCIFGSKHDFKKYKKQKCIYDETRSYEKFQLVANIFCQKLPKTFFENFLKFSTFCHFGIQNDVKVKFDLIRPT